MSILQLDRSLKTPLIKQLFDQLQKKILDGDYPAGFRLPSSRILAEELSVSRNVVLEAYDQLLAEGYVHSKSGSGTFVAEGASYRLQKQIQFEPFGHIGFQPLKSDLIDFRSGLPDLTLFPVNLWSRLSKEVYQEATPAQLAYGSPEGRMELREAIADYVRIHRGVKCHPEQILITAGTTQAIGLISRLLLQGDNKQVALEDPITVDIQHIIRGFGGQIHPVPIDPSGLMTEQLPIDFYPRFIYITPSHQFPLGMTMPIQRRIQLLEYANEHGSYIIEDDYDSEFRYDSMPINSLQGLDPEQVVYIGTFSKTLCPSLRMAYIIFPSKLVTMGRQIKWFTDLHNATMDQLTLAKFINGGHFARYVSRMKKTQKAKRLFTEKMLLHYFGSDATIHGSPAGLHLTVSFKDFDFNEPNLEELEKLGVKVYPVEEHTITKGIYSDTVIIGYGMLDTERIDRGLSILSRGLKQLGV